MPSPADDFLHRLLAAHQALDAFDLEPQDEEKDPLPTASPLVPPEPPGPCDSPAWEGHGDIGVPWLGGPASAQRFDKAAAAA